MLLVYTLVQEVTQKLVALALRLLAMKAFTLLHPLVALVDMQLIGVYAVPTLDLGKGSGPCDFGASKSSTTRQQEPACGATDGYVGSDVIYEDAYARIWNFTLAPGQSTSMHRHDHDYDFVAISPTQLEVYGEDGSRLLDFRAEGKSG